MLFFSDSAAWTRAARRAGWALMLTLVLLLVQSALWTDRVPWVLQVGVAGVALLAAVRPADALLVVAGLCLLYTSPSPRD